MKIIIITRLNWVIEEFDLFFKNYLKDYKEIFIKYIIYILIKKIHFI